MSCGKTPEIVNTYILEYSLNCLDLPRCATKKQHSSTTACVIHPDRYDFLQQLVVRDATVSSGISEVLIKSNLRVWVCLEQIELPLFRHPIIQSSITTQKQVAIDSLGKPLQELMLLR